MYVCVLKVLVQIEGKMRQLPEVRSCQVSSANPGTLQRLLHSFEHSLQLLVSQVRLALTHTNNNTCSDQVQQPR